MVPMTRNALVYPYPLHKTTKNYKKAHTPTEIFDFKIEPRAQQNDEKEHREQDGGPEDQAEGLRHGLVLEVEIGHVIVFEFQIVGEVGRDTEGQTQGDVDPKRTEEIGRFFLELAESHLYPIGR